VWATTFSVPAFFTESLIANACARENVLPEPPGQGGQSNLWQVAAKFRFRMAEAGSRRPLPSVFLHPPDAQISVGYPPRPKPGTVAEAVLRRQ
jgi:hypothetical protein